jgi:FtsZ-binding cell division protein ZapB
MMMTFLNQIAPVLQAILLLATMAGGVFVFRNSKKAGIVQIQSDTIIAMQQQIDALKTGQEALQKENSHLQYVIETISEALKQKNIFITVSGEMVTIEDAKGQSSTMRRAARQTPKKAES